MPINPADFELLGIHIKGEYFIDKCLPFGCSISCQIFETFSTFLEWAVRSNSNLHTVHHYLDDFIFAGRHNSNHCQVLLRSFQELCSDLGVPLNPDKTIEPTTLHTFLGLDIDTVDMQIKIPMNKVLELQALLNNGVTRNKLRLSELETLVGKLSFFSRAIPGSRAFIRRFYNAMLGPYRHYHHIRITNSLRQDMYTWLQFLNEFNGIVYFPASEWDTPNTLQLFTDSAGSGMRELF